jgi:hypothetical protein
MAHPSVREGAPWRKRDPWSQENHTPDGRSRGIWNEPTFDASGRNFPMRWSQVDDRFEAHLATSVDNKTWGLVPGGP